MVRSLVKLVGVQGIAIALVALATADLSAEPLAIDSLQNPAANAQTQPQQFPEVMDAVTKFRNRDTDGAYAALQDAAKKHPELPPAEVAMAQLYASARQDDMARFWLEKAVAVAPTDPEAYVMLGQDSLQNKRTTEALLLLNKANELLNSFAGDAKRKTEIQAVTSARLALLAKNAKDWSAVQTHSDLLLKVRPNDATALQLLARVLFEQKKLPEAIEKLKAAKMADEKLAAPEAYIAEWYEENGDRENAKKQMAVALKANLKDFSTRKEAAKWAFNIKEFRDAREQAEIAVKLKSEDLEARMLAGNVAIFQKDYPSAEKYFKEILAEAPGNFGAINNLALALCEQDNTAKQELALQYAQLNAKMYPRDTEALSTLGRAFFRLKRYGESDQVFRQVIASGSLSPDTAYYVAALCAATERKDDAKKYLQGAVKATGLFLERAEAEALLKQLGP